MQHTHFASGTFLGQAFFSVLIAGTFWRLAWSHLLLWGTRRNQRHVVGLSKAALYQY